VFVSYHKFLEEKVDANKEATEPRVLLNGSIESHHIEGVRVAIMT
jgi:hypothetical protein